MQLIENFNCEKMCNEEHCDKPHKYFCNFEFSGMKIHLAFCKKHAEQFEELSGKAVQDMEDKVE